MSAPKARPWEDESDGTDDLTLRDVQTRVDAWIGQFKEGYWSPLENLARLMEEVGELAREINHQYGSKPRKPEEAEQELAMELADVLFVVVALANEQGIDLEHALGRVLEKYRTRDHDRWERKQPGVPDPAADER